MEQVLILNGLRATGLGATVGPTALVVGIRKPVTGVLSFTITDRTIVDGQLEGTTLQLIGQKVGKTPITVHRVDGTAETSELVVTMASAVDIALLADRTADEIKRVTNLPTLAFDWQDAEVLRANYHDVYELVRSIYATARDLPGYRPQEYQLDLMLRVLNYAKAHPETETLREVVLGLIPTAETTASLGPSGRECHRTEGVVFYDSYTFARDTNIAFSALTVIAEVVGAIAAAIASIWTGGAAMAAYLAAIAAVMVAAAKYLPQYKENPKAMVADFGNAICSAIRGSGSPVRYQAATILRNIVIDALATGDRAAGQAALVSLQTIDQPQYFAKDPARNVLFLTAEAVMSGRDPEPGTGGAATPHVLTTQDQVAQVFRNAQRRIREQTGVAGPVFPPSLRAGVLGRGQSAGARVAQLMASQSGGSGGSSKAVVAVGGAAVAFMLWKLLAGRV